VVIVGDHEKEDEVIIASAKELIYLSIPVNDRAFGFYTELQLWSTTKIVHG